MGIKKWVLSKAQKASNIVSDLSTLSPAQLDDIEYAREMYLSYLPDMGSEEVNEYTNHLLAAGAVEIYNAYLAQLDDLYLPVKEELEFEKDFQTHFNIRYVNITKWVTDKKENNLEKLINVYQVLSNENCNIALVFNRTCEGTNVYLGISNMDNREDNSEADIFISRITDAIKGNFPGAEYSSIKKGIMPCLKNDDAYSVASISNIPTEKSKKFISQTIEKLIDGFVPDELEEEYTIILLATPVLDIEERKNKLGELYSALNPYASWQTNYTYTNSEGLGSSATVGVNVGASAGIQRGSNSSFSESTGDTTNESDTNTDQTSNTSTSGSNSSKSSSEGSSTSTGTSTNESIANNSSVESNNSSTVGGEAGLNIGHVVNVSNNASHTVGSSQTTGTTSTIGSTVSETLAKTINNTVTEGVSKSVANTIGNSISKTLGKAVTNTVGKTVGIARTASLGANFGANFARTSSVNATVGMNQGITQNYVNYNIKHTLSVLEKQMERYEKSTALGMWDFAGYIVSESQTVANNVAHSYLALTQGEESYLSQASINLWRGDTNKTKGVAKEICTYLRELRHPIFGLKPDMLVDHLDYLVYPPVVTATTSLSGQELAKSLNFPQKSIIGLPVIECVEFGRSINTYDFIEKNQTEIDLGTVFHMNHQDPMEVKLNKKSLASHTFITGSTGSGKSNTVYKILDGITKENVKFLVIEPTKGEYKAVFGTKKGVNVYGTNPALTPLLRINPFSFPKNIHIYEHMDRLVEIFNACWPMYAAMPAVLKNAIELSYEDCGWDLNRSVNKYSDEYFPCFKDVVRNITTIIDSSEYDSENKGAYKGSLITRLTSLTNGINGIIFTDQEISPDDLFDENVIVDLSRVGSAETKSLLMGMLVLKLQEYRMSEADSFNSELKHITVLEEAHNLLKRTSTEVSSDSSNLIGKSVEMISNSIAEMRTYGEGFIIVDQSPGLLDMSAIRNTNTKIIMRLPDQSDRELVGKAANLDEDQIKELARLPMGVGAIYQNNWIQPVLCKIDRYNYKNEKYSFDGENLNNVTNSNDDCLYIASLISSCESITDESLLKDIKTRLNHLSISTYIKIQILEWITHSPKEPKMTKMAQLMNELFPEISDSVKLSIRNSNDPIEWSLAAKKCFTEYNLDLIDEQCKRDIVHSIMIYNLLLVQHNQEALKDWVEGGYYKWA